MSSGSRRPASAVEPTRSTNITVSCRRSAWFGGAAGGPGVGGARTASGNGIGASRGACQGGDGLEQLAPLTDDGDAYALEVVGRELGSDLGVDLVVAERRLVASQAQIA
jgi:hypothetical protein